MPSTMLENKFRSCKTLGDTVILTLRESGPIGFSLVTAYKEDTDCLGRVQGMVAITTATADITCEGKTGKNCICLL